MSGKINKYYIYGEREAENEGLNVTCEVCNKLKPIASIVETNDRNFGHMTYICKHCADEQFTKCSRCNRYYTSSCRCFNPDASLANFDAKPSIIKELKVKDEKLLFGMEIEVTSQKDRDADITLLNTRFSEIGYCKHDGSVFNGQEFVTYPMSYEWIMKNIDLFKELEGVMVDRRMRATTALPQTNGLHIHMSKAAFRDFHLYKFIDFFYRNFKLAGYVSERAWTNIYRWSPLYIDKLKLAYEKKNPDKHVAINLKNPFTVEIRLFKSCIALSKILKNLQFCISVYEFTRESSPKDLEEPIYIQYINDNKSRYPELQKFLKYYRGETL